MIGIIGAMTAETEKLTSALEGARFKTVSGIKFASGVLCGKETVIAQCGIGKVFAAVCAQIMIMEYAPELIINVGVSGSLNPDLKIFDLVIARSTVQHDMDTTALGDKPGELSDLKKVFFECDEKCNAALKKSAGLCGLNFVEGVIASGDRFVHSEETKKTIVSLFGAVSCEMEGGGIGQVCYVNGVPYSDCRIISDDADGSAGMDFSAFLEKAVEILYGFILKFLEIYG